MNEIDKEREREKERKKEGNRKVEYAEEFVWSLKSNMNELQNKHEWTKNKLTYIKQTNTNLFLDYLTRQGNDFMAEKMYRSAARYSDVENTKEVKKRKQTWINQTQTWINEPKHE